MTYTTEEKIVIEGLKYESKIATMKAMQDARQEYEYAIEGQRETYNETVTEIKAKAGGELKSLIDTTIAEMREEDIYAEDEGDNDE